MSQQRALAFMLSIHLLMLVSCAHRPEGQTVDASTAALLPDELTVEEEKQAVALAEGALREKGLRTTDKLYVVGKELFRDKEAVEKGIQERKALVTHYRYDGDLAILTTVNLTRQTVINIETIPHLPTSLAPEEFEQAKSLAFKDREVKRIIANYEDRLRIEGLVTRASSAEDPLFGHRVVTLLFRVGADYLSTPPVMVDLTTETVIIETSTPSIN